MAAWQVGMRAVGCTKDGCPATSVVGVDRTRPCSGRYSTTDAEVEEAEEAQLACILRLVTAFVE